MQFQAESSGRSSQQLYDALRDYARSPGRSNVALHEPALLFASVRKILQIAADREPEAGPTTEEERAALRRAACFFMRTALLFPGADHYTLMGLDRNFDGAGLKDHYRLLMRLVHPDFAGTLPFAWPADTATRVNLAYEVLSSPVRRSEYEKDLTPAPKVPSPAKVEHRRTALVVRKPHVSISRSRFKQIVIISSAAGTCAVLITLLIGGHEPVRLVQRGQVTAAVAKPVAERVAAAGQDTRRQVAEPEAAPSASDPAMPAQPQRSPVAKAAVRSPVPPPQPSLRPVTLQNDTRPDSAGVDVAAAMRVPTAEPQPAVIPAAVASKASPAQSTAVSVAAPVAPPVPRSVAIAGVTLGEAQPLLSNLLLQLESGLGERVISLLDHEARTKPEAQSLSRQYDSLVDGMRPVRLSRVDFKAEPADGRLLVTSHVYLQVGEQTIGSPSKKIVLRAEFVSRDGTVVMTGLSGVPDN